MGGQGQEQEGESVSWSLWFCRAEDALMLLGVCDRVVLQHEQGVQGGRRQHYLP